MIKRPRRTLKTDVVRIRISPADKRRYEGAAYRRGVDLSTWFRTLAEIATQPKDPT